MKLLIDICFLTRAIVLISFLFSKSLKSIAYGGGGIRENYVIIFSKEECFRNFSKFKILIIYCQELGR